MSNSEARYSNDTDGNYTFSNSRFVSPSSPKTSSDIPCPCLSDHRGMEGTGQQIESDQHPLRLPLQCAAAASDRWSQYMSRTEIEIKGDREIYFPGVTCDQRRGSQDLPSFVISFTFSQRPLTYLKCHSGDHEYNKDDVISTPSVLSHHSNIKYSLFNSHCNPFHIKTISKCLKTPQLWCPHPSSVLHLIWINRPKCISHTQQSLYYRVYVQLHTRSSHISWVSPLSLLRYLLIPDTIQQQNYCHWSSISIVPPYL